MPKRVDRCVMPNVRVVDMRIETEKAGGAHLLSQDLVEAIRLRLAQAEQTMLFLNRRGYATSVMCPVCGYVETCPNCSVTMTYHKQSELMLCHVCGVVRKVPVLCGNPECQTPNMKMSGVGTQRVEAVVKKIFPKARIARMDSDTTGAKNAHAQILGEFRRGNIDILIGTQMIAKGLDFPNVTLVGVIYADLSLMMPDFRAGGAHVPAADAGGGARGPRRRARRGAHPDLRAVPSRRAIVAERRFRRRSSTRKSRCAGKCAIRPSRA